MTGGRAPHPSVQSRAGAAVRRRGARRARGPPAPGEAGAPGRDRGDPRARGVRRRVDVGERVWMPRVCFATGSTSCGRCCPSRQLPGTRVPVTPEDREQVIPWIVAFAEEALPEDNEAERQIRFVESRLAATDDAGLWFWEDGGRPVSISGYGGATPNGMRIGPVYTPPELRGRGYATTLVAEQSRWLLGTGRDALLPLRRPRQSDVERVVPPHRLPDDRRGRRGQVRSRRDAAVARAQHSGGGAGSPFLRDHDERDLARVSPSRGTGARAARGTRRRAAARRERRARRSSAPAPSPAVRSERAPPAARSTSARAPRTAGARRR